jgi:hypothetical protein
MSRFAAAIDDLDLLWKTRAGSAIVEASVEDQEGADAEVVTVDGNDALVLPGPAPRVAALVSGLVHAHLPGPLGRRVRVFQDGPRGWLPVSEAPPVPETPDEEPVFDDEEEDRP